MKEYIRNCPFCSEVNSGLHLERTGGWMVCEHCGSVALIPGFDQIPLVPQVCNSDKSEGEMILKEVI